jgi:hypothetical protein
VADYFATGIRNEGDCELSGQTQGLDDELLGVAGVRRMLKRGDRHSLNGRQISSGFASDFDFHETDCSASSA